MFLLDFILMDKNKEYLGLKLLIEWAIISIPAIWLGSSVFLLVAIAFLFLQLLRGIKILKIIGHPLEDLVGFNTLKHHLLSSAKNNNNHLFIVYLLTLVLILFLIILIT